MAIHAGLEKFCCGCSSSWLVDKHLIICELTISSFGGSCSTCNGVWTVVTAVDISVSDNGAAELTISFKIRQFPVGEERWKLHLL